MTVPMTASFTFNYVFNAGYHLILIIEAVGTVKLYINAELLSISIIDPNYPLIYSQIPVGQLYIGGSASNSNYLRGFVDEFHVFHKELSKNEINQLYNCTYHAVRSQYNISFASGTRLQINDGIEQYVTGNYKINLGLSSSIIGLQNQPDILNTTAITTVAIKYNMIRRIYLTSYYKKSGFLKYEAIGNLPTTGSWKHINIDAQPISDFSGNLDITRVTGNLPITRVSGLGGFTPITDGLKLFSSQQYLNYKLLIGNPALGDGNNKFAACIMTRAQNEYSRANLCFCVAPPSFSNTSESADIGNVRIEIKDSSFIEFNGNSGTVYGVKRYFNGYNPSSHNVWTYSLSTGYANDQIATSVNDCCAMFNGSIVSTSWIGSSSSYKIKKEIEQIDDNEALTKLLLLKPCKYRYIDDMKNFDATKKVYGFIAEEVKEILPEAIDDTTDQLIPNIYKLAKIENDTLTIDNELEIDIEYTIYIKNEDNIRVEDSIKHESFTKEEIKIIEKIDDNQYKINKSYNEVKEVFVYGKKEKNFNVLKKEYFHALTISSIQELHRIIERQNQSISVLENRLSILESINNNQ